MARGKKTTVGLAARPTVHTDLPSFEAFKGRQINTIDDLARLMEEFGIYRIYLRGPNSRMMSTDTREAEVGAWEVGVKMNTFIVDYHRSGGCSTLPEALEKALGVTVAQGEVTTEEEELLV